jgi:hypothetical protein
VTAIGTPAGPRVAGPGHVSWPRLLWVTWRQYRVALAGVTLLLGGLSVWMLISGLQVRSAMHHIGFTGCPSITAASCAAARQMLTGQGYLGTENTFAGVLQAVPALAGIFIGGPLLARELESGTFRFAWTQGCGRLRWVASRLVPLGVLVAAGTAVLSLVISWYARPFLAADATSVFRSTLFDLRGVDLAAWTLAAFTIAALAGLLIRRTVAAMAGAAAAWGGLFAVTSIYLRVRYEAPLVVTGGQALGPGGDGVPWVLKRWMTGPDGHALSSLAMGRAVSQARSALGTHSGPAATAHWLARHGYIIWQQIQPPGRFWHFQLIESGGLLALTLLLGAATIWLVRRRSA